jgi:ADP-ribose pyrophosphatase YjhB (NUDIX family)
MSSSRMARLVPQSEGSTPEDVVHISSFALVRKGGQLLLIKRLRPERAAGWCIPGTLLLYGEDPAETARRTLKDQVGATATGVKLLDVFSFGDKHWDICFVYEAEIPEAGKLGQDFEKADYFDLANLPPDTRADHREVLDVVRSKNL